jgi:predicted ester cyclase
LGVALTVSDIRENLTQLYAAFEELHLDEDLLFGGDGHVCARWTLRGVHTGEYGGIAPTRREIAVDTCEVYTFTGDKVTECHVYGETMSLFNQLSGSAHD